MKKNGAVLKMLHFLRLNIADDLIGVVVISATFFPPFLTVF